MGIDAEGVSILMGVLKKRLVEPEFDLRVWGLEQVWELVAQIEFQKVFFLAEFQLKGTVMDALGHIDRVMSGLLLVDR